MKARNDPVSIIPDLDRRSAERVRVDYRFDLYSGPGWVGYLVDLSRTGMRIVCDVGIDITKIRRLRIVLPRWLDMGDSLELRCRSAWWRPRKQDDRVEAGLAIDSLPRKLQGRLDLLLERLAEASAEDGWS